jgi:ABC-type branched-subunit amino acid transport system substrate-binding protein
MLPQLFPRFLCLAALVLLGTAGLGACTPSKQIAAAPQPPPVVEAPSYPSETLPYLRNRADDYRSPHMGTATPTRVAILLPLHQNGSRNGLAQSMLNAAQLALFEFGSDNLILLPKDTKGTEEGARSAIEEALRQGAELILGPLYAEEVRGVGALARGNGVTLIGFSSDRTVAGGGVYLLSFPPEDEVSRVISFAAQRGVYRFAALGPRSAYGDRALASLEQSLAQAGLTPSPGADGRGLVAVERYAPMSGALIDPALRLAGQGGFDALFIPEGGSLLKEIGPVLETSALNGRVRLLGTGLWDDASLGQQSVLVGGWFAAPAPSKRAQFVARYTEVYGNAPARLASLAYDAVSLAITLSRQGGGSFPSQALHDPNGFDGVDGIFRFREDGTVQRGLAVLEIRQGGAVVVDQPPSRFDVLY